MTELLQQLAEAKMKLTYTGSPFEMTEIEVGGKSRNVYKNAAQLIPQLAMQSRQLGDKTFLVYEGEKLSFDEFFAQVDVMTAQMVTTFGVKPGDRVAIAMRNYPEWMVAFFAICSIGAVVVPLNSWGKAAELSYGIDNAQARLVFTDERRYELLESNLEHLNCQAIVVRSTLSLGGMALHYQALLTAGADLPVPQVDIQPDDTALILYTSGTTGVPKGAVSSHRSICQAIFNFSFVGAQASMTSPAAAQKMATSAHEPAALLTLPLFHVSGLHSVFLLNLNLGRKVVIMHKWDATRALELIEEERISAMSGVPSMTMDILQHDKFSDTDTSSLFNLGGGGAACPPDMKEVIYTKLPHAMPGSGYGLTESNAVGAFATGEAYRQNPKAAGIPSPIIEVQIRDAEGKTLSGEASGHIWISGVSVIEGYWNDPEATAEYLVDGWFDTGDIGYLDAQGYLYIVDRSKDMIIRGGENIYAAEVEACLLHHPQLSEAAAIGVPDDKLGEELAVVVYGGDALVDAEVDAEEIQSFVKERLADFKVPRYVLISPQPLPKNATGKIIKQPLRSQLSAIAG